MKQSLKTHTDMTPARKRSGFTVELAVVGVLAGLVVSAWGSYFATAKLYPAYVAAFVVTDGGDTPPSDPIALRVLPPQSEEIVMAAAPNDFSSSAKMSAEIEVLSDLPEKLASVSPAPDLSPEAFARLSNSDAALRDGASLLRNQPTPPVAEDVSPIEMLAARPTEAPEDAVQSLSEVPTVTVATELAVLVSPRPVVRPQSATVASQPDNIATATEEDTITTSSMNAPTQLAVLVSPRPRTLPSGLRAAALQPTRQENAALTNVALQSPSEQELRPAPRASGKGCGRNNAASMPNRRNNATAGSQFFAAVGNESGSGRDRQIINELAKGNMPGFLHDLQPVVLRGRDSRGGAAEIVICVTPDYLALGSDRDFVRVPLGLPAAASIAGQFGMMLPTSRMVDAIYQQATVRLSPSPMQAGPQMSSTDYFVRHNATVEGQRHGRSGLIAGHKKDLVMANRMSSNPGRVAIYGWHRSAGDPIQPVSTVHGASYADYSHGIRLVSTTAYLNGRAVNLEELLSSSRYAYLLNTDGPLPGAVIQVASR